MLSTFGSSNSDKTRRWIIIAAYLTAMVALGTMVSGDEAKKPSIKFIMNKSHQGKNSM